MLRKYLTSKEIYNAILRKENNSAVIGDLIIVQMVNGLKNIVETVKPHLKSWGQSKIFSEDISEYTAYVNSNPDIDLDDKRLYCPKTILAVEKIKIFATGYENSPFSQIVLNEKKINWKTIRLDKIDNAGIIKVFTKRRISEIDLFGFKPKGRHPFYDLLDELSLLRNEFEGHLDEESKHTYQNQEVFQKIQCLKNRLEKIRKSGNFSTLSWKNQINDMFDYLENLNSEFSKFTSFKISFDSREEFSAEDLFPYNVFLVYPNGKSDRFRRFCNGALRDYYAKGSGKTQIENGKTAKKVLYTDYGTILHLEELVKSELQNVSSEAKHISKSLFAPLVSENELKIMRLDGLKHNPNRINTVNYSDVFFEKIRKTSKFVCIVTEDKKLAAKINGLSKRNIVAVKILNEQKVTPF